MNSHGIISPSIPTHLSLYREIHIQKKIDALACYETQKDRAYLNPDFIRGLALTRGTQIEETYAEAFEVIKWVI